MVQGIEYRRLRSVPVDEQLRVEAVASAQGSLYRSRIAHRCLQLRLRCLMVDADDQPIKVTHGSGHRRFCSAIYAALDLLRGAFWGLHRACRPLTPEAVLSHRSSPPG